MPLQTLPPGLNVTWAPPPNGTSPPPLSSASVLLRVRHIFAAGEGPGSGWGTNVTVDLAALLAPSLAVTGAVELTADAARPLAAARTSQIQWAQLPAAGEEAAPRAAAPGEVGAPLAASSDSAAPAAGLVVTLQPMEIRTFLLQLQ